MNTFLALLRKEFYHILRDRRTLLILVGMPVIQLILFGFAIRNELNDVRVVIVDPSNDAVTRAITERLLASPYFEAVGFVAGVAEVEAHFQAGNARQALVFAPDFAERLARDGRAQVQVITDATDPNTANTALSYTTAILSSYQRERMGGRTVAGVRPEVRMRYNPSLESVYLFVPGLIAFILMLVCALMTSITLTREKELGTMEVLTVSPLRPLQIVVGKVIPYLVIAQGIVAVILLLSRFVFHVPMRGSLGLLLAECLLFTVCSLSLGILISSRTSSQQTAMMISLAGLLLPTIILSGFIFPVDSMPLPLQTVSHIVPAKWFLVIVRGIMIQGVGLAYIWKETLVLAGMTLFYLFVSTRRM